MPANSERHPRADELHQMLEALVEHRRPQGLPFPRPTPVIFDAEHDNAPIPARWVSHVNHAKKDAVEAALYAVIREEGWAAYAEGRADEMHRLFDDVTGDSELLAAILDHRWDRIGGVWFA